MKWYIYIASTATGSSIRKVRTRRLVVYSRSLRDLLVRLVLRLLLVDEVKALGLDDAVNEAARESRAVGYM